MRTTAVRLILLTLTALALACNTPDDQGISDPSAPRLAVASAGASPAERATLLAAGVNRWLEHRGSRLRVTGASFFTVGVGVPEFRSHTFGARWPVRQLTYLLDASDFTPDEPAADVEAALVNAYETWTAVPRATLELTRVADINPNPDLLDAIVLNGSGECVDIVDVDWQGPYADIVSGGWLSPDYFSKCLGSEEFVAVTWTFSDDSDLNHDGYDDLVYIEQYFNSEFQYATSGSVFLDFTTPLDIQSIAVHEDGHAFGLAHTGGPNPLQPLILRPTGQIFTPEAIMNPVYFNGEKRSLYPLDIASLGQLYTRNN